MVDRVAQLEAEIRCLRQQADAIAAERDAALRLLATIADLHDAVAIRPPGSLRNALRNKLNSIVSTL